MTFRDSNLKLAVKNCFKPTDQSIVVLEPHLGLGDNLVCLGLVRELLQREPNTHFYYVCLHRCYHSLVWMFQDLENVFLFAVKGGRQARQLAGFLNARYVPIGIEGVDLKRFDAFFYDQHRVPFDLRWSNAHVPAGPKSEQLYQMLNPKNEPYFLVCNSDSGSSRYQLKIDNPGNIKVIEVQPLTNNIFDWSKLVACATQIHTIDTSFVHFVESELYGHALMPLHYHLARISNTEFTRRLPWRLVHYR
jgi:hypothetical protein